MSHEKRARTLALWLEQGGEPPEDLDPEVIEAISILRPDLAPPPRVDLDDILASVQEGPLAAEPQGEVVPFPSPSATQSDTPTPTSERPAWSDRARRWGGLGALVAVAATVLLVARPLVSDELPTSSAPAREMRAEPALQTEPVLDAQKPTSAPVVRDEGSSATRAPAEPPPAPSPAADAGRPAPAPTATQKPAAPTAMQKLAAPPPPATGAAMEPAFETPESTTAPAVGYDGSTAGASPAPVISATESAPTTTVEVLAAERNRKGLFGRKAESASTRSAPAPAAAPPPPAAEPAYDFAEVADSDQALPLEAAAKESVGAPLGLSDQARPRDLGGWAAGLEPRVAEEFRSAMVRAEALAAEGRRQEAVELLDRHVIQPARAGQEVARRLALLQLQEGRYDAALSAVERGLALSAAPSPERVGLLWARGEILAQRGDPDGARAAWEEAIRVREGR